MYSVQKYRIRMLDLMKPLTEKQQVVLSCIGQYLASKGFPPTLREIGDAAGIANVNAVRGHILALERKGYITKEADKARSIRVIHTPSMFSRLKRHLHEVAGTDDGALHKVVYGVALVTRKRRQHLVGPARQWMDEALEQRAIEHGWKYLRKEIHPSHIAVVVEVWPNHSPDLVVSRIRQSGNMIRLRHLNQFAGKTLWAKGYVVTTSIESLDDMLARLLQNTPGEQDK